MKKYRTIFAKTAAAAVMIISIAVIALAASSTVSAAETYRYADVYLDGRIICAGETLTLGQTMFVPLDSFCNAVSDTAEVYWESGSDKANVTGDSLEVSVTLGDTYICANGRYLNADYPNMILWGRVYVALDTIAAAFDARVDHNTHNSTSHLTSGSGAITPADEFYNAEDLYWLSRIISAECRGESLGGQIAVGNVVMNRANLPSFPSTIYEVIFDRRISIQFTPTGNGMIYKNPAQKSIIAAKIVLEGYTMTENAIYFLDENICGTNNWISRTRTFVFRIGCHTFYQ